MSITPDDLALYVTGGYDGDIAALEAAIAEQPAARTMLAEEAQLEVLLRDAAAAAVFCPTCDDLVPADRCATCGAAVRAGGYTIERVLVQNAHGRMYLARDADRAQVALKELAFVQAPGVDALAAFERETRCLRALEHPAIPRFVASWQEGHGVATRYYLAQELVSGDALDGRLADHWFDEREIVDIARQVLTILVYLQNLSPMVVHRDIKPANLLRRPDGSIALVDFGAAHVQGTTVGSTSIGTFGYMPVEQMAGMVDATTDPYALGMSLLHLSTRREPWQLLQAPAWDAVNLSAGLRAFLHRLVASDPAKRFPTAAAALAALDHIGIATRRPLFARAPVRAMLAAAAALVLAGGGVYGGLRLAHQEPLAPAHKAERPVLPPMPVEHLPATPRISLDAKDLLAGDFMRLLGESCGLNMVMPSSFEFHKSLHVHDAPCDQTIEVALESEGLWYRYDAADKLVRIATRKDLDREDAAAVERQKLHSQLGLVEAKLPAGDPVTLDFKDVPLADLLSVIAAVTKINIVVPDSIEERITVKLAKVPWDRALETILEANGLWYRYRESGRLVRVATRKDLDREDAAELARRGTWGDRPASISDADVAVFDILLPGLEKLAEEVRTADDCAAATAAVTRATARLGPLLEAASKIDLRTKADPDAEAWAHAHYAPKLEQPMNEIMHGACASDGPYSRAVEQLQK